MSSPPPLMLATPPPTTLPFWADAGLGGAVGEVARRLGQGRGRGEAGEEREGSECRAAGHGVLHKAFLESVLSKYPSAVTLR